MKKVNRFTLFAISTSKDIDGIFYSKYHDLYNSLPSDVNEVESFVKRNINNVEPDDFEVWSIILLL